MLLNHPITYQSCTVIFIYIDLCAKTNNECAIDIVVVVGWYGVRALEPNNVEQIQKRVQVRIENAK